jgi:predicted Zn finger-like uncharacterized protein
MATMWYEDSCPECSSSNWFTIVDSTDMTAPDLDAVKCWKCKHVWRLSENDEEDVECAEGRNFQEIK